MTSPEPRPGPGRFTRLTRDTHDHIVRLVKAGNYLTVAAAHAGIGESTLHLWLKTGREVAQLLDGDPDAEVTDYQRRCVELLESVTQADTEAEAAAVVAWRSQFSNDWRAARDYLVRRHPHRWAATTRIAISAEESEQRMDRATQEVLASLGLDTVAGEMPDEEWDGDVADADDA